MAPESTRPLCPDERWYVAMTLPHKERVAAVNLFNQGYRHFLPLQRTTLRHGRLFRTSLAPVFPRYLFVALDATSQRWRRINGTFGVRYLICQGERPLPVPLGVVETLLQSCKLDGCLITPAQMLETGQNVRILSGCFAGLPGVVQRLEGAERVQLLLAIMGGMFVATTSREGVTPV